MKFFIFVLLFSFNSFANDYFIDCDFKLDNGKKVNLFNNGTDDNGQTELTFQYDEDDIYAGTFKTTKITSKIVDGFNVEVFHFAEGKLMLVTDDYSFIKNGILSLDYKLPLSEELSLDSIEVSCAVSK